MKKAQALSILSELRNDCPPRGLIHIGSGGGASPFSYAEWGLPHVLLIDAGLTRAPHKRGPRLCKPEHPHVREVLIGGNDGPADFMFASSIAESGLINAEELKAYWPNFSAVSVEKRTAITLDTFLAQETAAALRFNWLLIACFPAVEILKGATETLENIDVVIARVIESPDGGYAASKSAVDRFLFEHNFGYCGFQEGLHPNIGHAVYVKANSKAKILGTSLPPQFIRLASTCFKADDPFEAIDAILLSPDTCQNDKLLFSIALADQFTAQKNKMAATSFLRIARDHLEDSTPWDRRLLISRFVKIGEMDEALDLVLESYMYGSGSLALSTEEKALFSHRHKENLAKLKSFEQHGHALLLSYLDANRSLLKPMSHRPKVLVEIGTTRENVEGQGSTRLIADFCKKHEVHFITVDMDPHNTRMAAEMFARLQMPFEAVNMKGEDFLRSYAGQLDFVFLDAYDFDHGKHSELRQSRYMKFLGGKINDEDCHRMHLDCAQSIFAKLAPNGIVCFDDTWLADDRWTAKGVLAMPYLLQNGFSVIEAGNRAALLVRTPSQEG